MTTDTVTISKEEYIAQKKRIRYLYGKFDTVKVKENLLDVIDEYFEGKEDSRTNTEFLELCDRIAGQYIKVHYIAGDAFELEDDEFYLPECCYDKVGIMESSHHEKENYMGV